MGTDKKYQTYLVTDIKNSIQLKMSAKRKSKEFIASDSDSDSDSGAEVKKKKVAKEEKPSKSKAEKSDDGKLEWELGKSKKVTVREFKGKVFVDIREYYCDKAGDWKPGKKGIALQRDQWDELLASSDAITAAFSRF